MQKAATIKKVPSASCFKYRLYAGPAGVFSTATQLCKIGTSASSERNFHNESNNNIPKAMKADIAKLSNII